MSGAAWHACIAALDEAAAEGKPVRFWLRDDDARTVTPALERLAALSSEAGAPMLLAVIPDGATAALADWLEARPHLTPCQHGYAHRNHAAPGERACELGGEREDEAVLDDLARGRRQMERLFGDRALPALVPPWNRIRPSLLPHLGRGGHAALSTFAGSALPPQEGLARLDCDIDIIDWRAGRRGRSDDDLGRRLLALIGEARTSGAPIGLLTHHLAHDEAAWSFLDRWLSMIARHHGAAFTRFEDEVARVRPAPQ